MNRIYTQSEETMVFPQCIASNETFCIGSNAPSEEFSDRANFTILYTSHVSL